ncbi:MAG: hypothetical protein IJX59_02185, partial [Clostridia bacterium]|nr:hypothetical protein [Clostridia bacterium]
MWKNDQNDIFVLKWMDRTIRPGSVLLVRSLLSRLPIPQKKRKRFLGRAAVHFHIDQPKKHPLRGAFLVGLCESAP